MSHKLHCIFQYRLLLSKTVELRIPLTVAERLRLDRLRGQLPTAVPQLEDDDAATRLHDPLPAEFVCSGRFRAARVRSVSGGGLALVTAEPPRIGQHLLVHVWDPTRSIEYTFPTRVVERVPASMAATARLGTASAGMSVAFEGLPLQTFLMSARQRCRGDDSSVHERFVQGKWRSTS
jgi:hypothetical protein